MVQPQSSEGAGCSAVQYLSASSEADIAVVPIRCTRVHIESANHRHPGCNRRHFICLTRSRRNGIQVCVPVVDSVLRCSSAPVLLDCLQVLKPRLQCLTSRCPGVSTWCGAGGSELLIKKESRLLEDGCIVAGFDEEGRLAGLQFGFTVVMRTKNNFAIQKFVHRLHSPVRSREHLRTPTALRTTLGGQYEQSVNWANIAEEVDLLLATSRKH